MTIIGLNCTEAVTLKAADRQTLFAAIKAVGVNDIRIEIPWELGGATGTSAAGLKTADAVMADAKTAGLSVLMMVAHPPSPTPTAVNFGVTMGVLAKRYPQVVAFEIWNEPNLQDYWPKGNPTTFVPYLQAAYHGIKANSNTPVLLGGLAAAASASRAWYQFWVPAFTNTSPTDFLTGAIAAGAIGYFDGFALHPYSLDAGFRWLTFSPTNPYVADIPALQALIATADNGTFLLTWATEYGFPISSFTVAEQQTNLAAATSYLATKCDRLYIESARDFPAGEYGLMDKNGAQRPAYAWLKGYLANA